MKVSIKDLDNKDGHDRLIGGNKKYFAARAWEGYLNGGRGALIIRMSKVEEVRRSPGFYLTPSEYAPAGSEQLVELKLWPDERMAKALQGYCPEEEVVFVFVHLNGEDFSCYTWKTPEELTPPKAYEQVQQETPIGMKLNPNRTLFENLKLLVNHEFEEKQKRNVEERKILSDPSRQAEFISTLITEQQNLRMEIKSKGVDIDQNENAYVLEGIEIKPGTAFDRLIFQAKIIEYLAATTAVNQMARVYEEGKASGDNWLKDVAKVGLKALDDKRLVCLASTITLDWGQESDMQELFVLLTAAHIRVRLRKFPRLMSALEAEGGNPEDALLGKLPGAVILAWSRYEEIPHSPAENDSNRLIGFVEDILEKDETITNHHRRLLLEQLRKERKKYVSEMDIVEEDQVFRLESAVRSKLEELMAEDLLTRQEKRIYLQELIEQTNFSPRQMEVLERLLEGKKCSTIADELNMTESTARVNKHDIYKKLLESAARK